MIPRRTPLRRTPLRRTPWTRSVTREDPELTRSRRIVKNRARGWCEVRIHPVCRDRGTMAHHVELRRHGRHDPENLLWVCGGCHDWIHGHPEVAYTNGWLKKGNR